jgi:hypothetical protein
MLSNDFQQQQQTIMGGGMNTNGNSLQPLLSDTSTTPFSRLGLGSFSLDQQQQKQQQAMQPFSSQQEGGSQLQTTMVFSDLGGGGEQLLSPPEFTLEGMARRK